MTAKDYELIAAAIHRADKQWNDFYGETVDSSAYHGVVVAFLEEALKRDNPRFNPSMFNAACRGE